VLGNQTLPRIIPPTLWLGSFLLFFACQTSLNLNTSPPGTTVREGDKVLGTTPLTLSEDKFPSTEAAGHLLTLEREGYKKIWLWVPKGIRGLDLLFNLEVFQVSEVEANSLIDEKASREELYKLSWELLRAQTAIFLNKRADDPAIAKTLENNESLGVVRYLAALGELRSGNYDGALKNLEQAVLLAPREADFLGLLNDVRKRRESQGK
jgi:hypothetical protein